MSAQSSSEKKLRSLVASDLGESLIDAVLHDDKKLAKAVLKSGT